MMKIPYVPFPPFLQLRVESSQTGETGNKEREHWQREFAEQEEKWRIQLHELRDRHHNKLEEQCKKHSDAIEMINKLRAQLAGRGNEHLGSPSNGTAFLERKLQETYGNSSTQPFI